MKLLNIIVLSLSLSGCATIRRHPVAYGMLIGAAAGTGIALATRPGTCPVTPEYPKGSGTPPCPK